jgi:hypothetical protein
VKKLLLAGILLATPAYADSWSDFYAQHPPAQVTPIEMRKSWQDQAADAVRKEQNDWEDKPYWWKGEGLRMDWNAPSMSDAPQWILYDCTKQARRYLLRYKRWLCR